MVNKPTYEELEQRLKDFENGTLAPKRSKEGLQRSAERFRRLFEQASDSFFVHDFNNGKIVDANESACKHLGYTRNELLELNVSDIEVSHTPEAIVEICGRVETDGPVIVEGTHRRKDGSTFPVEISFGMLQNEDPALLLAIARDTTERKKAEVVLQESKEKYRGLIEGLDEAIYRMALPDGKYEYISPAAKKVLGYSAEEFMENPSIIRKIIHPDFAEYFKEKWADLIEGKVPPTYKYKILDPEGNERWIVQSNTGIFDDSGNIIAIEGLCRDITNGAQAEKELRESEEKFRTFTEMAPVGVFVTDTGGLTTYWNKRLCEITGMRVVDGLGTGWADGVHPDDRERVFKEWYESAEKRASFSCEYRFVDKDGAVTHTIGQASPLIDASSCVTGYVGTITDVTDLKQADEALRESKENYRLMFEKMVSGFALLEMMYDESGKPMDCRYIEANPAHEKLTGLKTSEIIDRTARESIPGLEGSWIENYAQVDRTGKPMEIENYVEGLKSWYKVFAYRTKPGLVAVTFENITDSKRAQETLKTREHAIQSSINGINFTDLQGNFIYANNSFLKMWDFKTRDDLIGRNISDLWVDQNRYQKAFSEFQEKGSYMGELEAKKQDGTKFDVQISANTVKSESGEPLFLMASFVDITERNQAHEALRESEEKYRRIFENIQDVYYESSLDGAILEISPSIENISQYKREELIGMSLYDIYINPKERDGFVKLIQDKGKVNDFEIALTDKDGSKRPCSITTLLVKDDWGNPVKLVGSMRDISERKQNEEERKRLQDQLQQAQKMEAMGTLAGGIAHDFNNLLMAIQGRTSIMLTKKDSSHPDIRHLKGIEGNVESAANLTNQLLGFARGGKYEVRPTDLNELIKKQNRMFGRTKKEVTIRGKYEENPWSVEVDRGQIEQVLLNLYINAWQAMPGGGNLNLETENVTLDENYVKPFSIEPGRYVKTSVTDTGVGMDKATREKIFEPFFTTKEMGRGTGLGLASVYGIIKNHGGFINVYSEKGHGTTFNIYLPASEKEIIDEKKPAGDTLRGTETVLFVDDEDMIIEIAEELFEQLGYKVLIARSGKEAIETYEKNKERIDIVLLDMIMPDMSGSDTYDRMKKIDPKVKVLLFSGYSINGQATEIMDRGCNGFIQKPFKMKELSQKLREILDDK